MINFTYIYVYIKIKRKKKQKFKKTSRLACTSIFRSANGRL